MYVDSQLLFSSAQAITAAAASTNVVDLGAVRDIGSGEALYLVVVVTTAMTDASSDSTITVAMEGDSTTTITPDGTENVLLIPALSAVGATFFAALNPGSLPLQYRYVRLLYTPTGGDLSTGSFTAFLTKDIAKYKAYAKAYTIS
jgi:hypothetical protein